MPDTYTETATETVSTGLVGAVVSTSLFIALAIIALVMILKYLRIIARPHEALVFSGLSHKGADGQTLGYKVIQQGRGAVRIPFVHRVDRMDMRLLPIDIVVQNAYSNGNIPLYIHAIANVKIHSDSVVIRNAIERFLGRSVDEIEAVAKQTLEGAVREVVAALTPEQVNEDRLLFAERLIHTADDDLTKLGLQLDTLKIQNVSDSVNYLDSLGRPQIAAALRDAENSENEAQLEITRAQAAAGQRAEVAKTESEKAIAEKRNALRTLRAELEGHAASVELEAEAAAKTTRARVEQELQTIRAALEERRLIADVVIPAHAAKEAEGLRAVGAAAPTVENGAAAVEVLKLMSDAWRSMGTDAREIYVIQHLEELVGVVVSQLDTVKVGEVNILDPGDGSGLASYAATYPKMVAEVLGSLAATTGVDIPAILNDRRTERAV